MALDLSKEDNETKAKFSIKSWSKLLKYALEKWPLLVVLILTILLTSFYDKTFVPLMNSAAINTLDNLGGKIVDINSVTFTIQIFGATLPPISFGWYVGILFIGIVVRSVAIYFTFFITNYLDMSIMTSLRRDSFKVVQELSFSYYDKTPSGWLIARIQNDTASIGDVMSWSLIRLIWCSAEIILTIITMFTVDWILSLIILAMAPVIFFVVSFFRSAILSRSRKARNAYSNYVRWLAECISGIKTIKTLAIEDNVSNEQDEITTEVKDLRYKAFRLNAFFTPIFAVLSAVTTAIILYCATNVKIGGQVISIANLILFIGFVSSIYNPLSQFSELFSDFVSTQANVEKITSLIETKPQIVDTPEVIEKYGTIFEPKTENYEPIDGKIEFKNVSFSYIEGVEVIHDMNLTIEKGTSLAIVGETGSGKSTTVNLLCRFYEPTKGEILIDNVNYKEKSLGWLRSNIGYVQQTPFVFSSTFRENIAYGKPDASLEQIRAAAQIVGIDSYIMSFPQGYDTKITDGGSGLSVGQKQLISFARAIVRNPSIMILDEATSSIDTETEKAIQDTISVILHNRTSIIIAHRLSTVVDCDRILVMKDGLIVEDGNHVTLMKQKGYYYKLYTNQFKELDIESQIKTYDSQIKGKGLD